MSHVVNLSVSRQKMARYVSIIHIGAYLAREFHGSYCSGLIWKSGKYDLIRQILYWIEKLALTSVLCNIKLTFRHGLFFCVFIVHYEALWIFKTNHKSLWTIFLKILSCEYVQGLYSVSRDLKTQNFDIRPHFWPPKWQNHANLTWLVNFSTSKAFLVKVLAQSEKKNFQVLLQKA